MTGRRAPRPRFTRIRNPESVSITDRDKEWFRALNEYRILRTSHLSALTGSTQRVTNRRLEKLYDNKYINRIDPRGQNAGSWNNDTLHVLDLMGAKELTGENAKPKRDLKRKAGRDYVSHTLLTADFLVSVRVACNKSGGRVRYIPTSEILAGSIRSSQSLPLKISARVPLGSGGWQDDTTNPDGMFGLEFPEHRKRKFFFLEADRGSMPQARTGSPDQSALKKKYKVYHYFRTIKGAAEKEFGFRNFHVLLLTDKEEERARNAQIHSQVVAEGKKTWLFAHKAYALDPENNVLTIPWLAGDGQRYSLSHLKL